KSRRSALKSHGNQVQSRFDWCRRKGQSVLTIGNSRPRDELLSQECGGDRLRNHREDSLAYAAMPNTRRGVLPEETLWPRREQPRLCSTAAASWKILESGRPS